MMHDGGGIYVVSVPLLNPGKWRINMACSSSHLLQAMSWRKSSRCNTTISKLKRPAACSTKARGVGVTGDALVAWHGGKMSGGSSCAFNCGIDK